MLVYFVNIDSQASELISIPSANNTSDIIDDIEFLTRWLSTIMNIASKYIVSAHRFVELYMLKVK